MDLSTSMSLQLCVKPSSGMRKGNLTSENKKFNLYILYGLFIIIFNDLHAMSWFHTFSLFTLKLFSPVILCVIFFREFKFKKLENSLRNTNEKYGGKRTYA